jgi:hypothetical protein
MLILPRESATLLPMCAGHWVDSARAAGSAEFVLFKLCGL